MLQLKILSCLICLAGMVGSINGADKYTDENRPYEFGFTIDGEQHRHEKKDENGIIMGEFGFITADGVYHVTVYATDENGRFKILSMKNIRVKPYPTAGGSEKKGHSIPFPPSKNAPVVQGPSSPKSLTTQKEIKAVNINKPIASPAKSCSHCSLPTTTTKAPPPQLTDIAIVSKDRQLPNSPGITIPNEFNNPISSSSAQSNFNKQETDIGNSFPSSYSKGQSNPLSSSISSNSPNYPQDNYEQNPLKGVKQSNQNQDIVGNTSSPPSSETHLNYPQQYDNDNPNIPQTNQFIQNTYQNNPQYENSYSNSLSGNTGNQLYPQEQSNTPLITSQGESGANLYYPQEEPKTNNDYVPSGTPTIQSQPGQEYIDKSQTFKDTSRTPKQYNDIPTFNVETAQKEGFGAALASQDYQPISNRPTLLAAQMQIVPKDTDIHHRNPGEVEGLPNGISKDDMTHLLYTFNFTVGFHGHQEEGYSNGAKKGYYYVTGRNGIRTRIDYIADEKGFRPRISQEVLDILSDEVPKPETEKDEKFGLKGYEFKWIYYPRDERN